MIKKIIKKIFGERIMIVHKKLLNFFQRKVPVLFSWSGISASFYYLFFSSKFRNEHYTILKAKLNHYSYKKFKPGHIYHMRRQVHRLEKGLSQKYRKNTFGLGFIEETILLYSNYVKSDFTNEVELAWFNNILDAYFSEVRLSEKFKKTKDLYLKNRKETKNYERNLPFKRENNTPVVPYTEFLKMVKHRKSIRWYLDKKVDRKIIDEAITAAVNSPSACNRHAFTYYVVDNKEKAREIANISFGTLGFAHEIPGIIVVVGDQSAYFDEWDRHLIYIESSLSSMLLMLALESLGVSSCPINWPDIANKNKAIKKILNLNHMQQVVMLISFGYYDPDTNILVSERPHIERARKYID